MARPGSAELHYRGQAAGYDLTHIQLRILQFPTTASDLEAELWDESSRGDPGSRVATLSFDSTSTGLRTLTPTADTTLDPSTVYFLLLRNTSGTGDADRARVEATVSNSESGETGWSIGDVSHQRGSGHWVLSHLVSVRILVAAEPGSQVSNLSTDTGSGPYFGASESVDQVAQSFTTGTNAAGYDLDRIQVRIQQFPATASDLDAELWDESGGEPDSSVATLSFDSTSTGVRTLTPTAEITLDPSTVYFLLLRNDASGSASADRARVDAREDNVQTSSVGWSIGDDRHQREGSGNWGTSGLSLEISVFAQTVFVSNLTADSEDGAGLGASESFDQLAQSFTTGPNTGGYNLLNIQVRIKQFPTNASDLDAELWDQSGGNPDSRVATLSFDSTSTGVRRLTPTAEITLDPSTVYFLLLRNDASGTGDADRARVGSRFNNLDSHGEVGWLIGDDRHQREGGGSWSTSPYSLLIRVEAEHASSNNPSSNNPATGRPTISGTAQVGQTLTSATSGIADDDGLGAFTYEWARFAADGTTREATIGTDSSMYTLTDAEESKRVKVSVTFTDGQGNGEGPLASDAFPSSGTIAPEPDGGGGGGGGNRNRGPEAVGTLADRTLEVGESVSVDLSAAFRDRDEDVLTYGGESSSAEVVSVSVSGGMATLTALSVGETAVTLTATDAAGSNRTAEQAFTVTVAYDPDGDGLIGVHTLAQLDAVRYDLDGDGMPAAAGSAGYAAAFAVTGTAGVSCGAASGCRGYELGSDLDLDTNGSGGPDAGDVYWFGGAGWLPLGTASAPFLATFEGNGHRIEHVFVRRSDAVGLFGATGASSVIRHLGVVAVDVAGTTGVGALVGVHSGTVTGSYAAGQVSGAAAVGGLVGSNAGFIGGSFATARVSGGTSTGGLVGVNDGGLAAGYATGIVSGTQRVGGLAGYNRGRLTAGYATGRVSGAAAVGGLAGETELPGAVTAGYWDTDTSARPAGEPGERAGAGRPTSALQAPTDYAGLYAAWNVDVDGDGAADAPWDFGTDSQYPALSLDADGDGRANWQEVGRQLRSGPVVHTPSPGVDPAQVVLTWAASETGSWTPPPAVSYTVYRFAGGVLETVAAGIRGERHTDLGVEPGGAYLYQVAAVVDGGEAVRSAPVTATVPCAYTVTPLHRDVLWPAGTGEVTVTTGSTCAWTAASESGFLAVTAGAAARGSGTVTYTLSANTGGPRGPRTGTLLVAGRRVTVFQASATVFTDHPIERGVTPVRAIHFLELRARVDALRASLGLPAFGWTDPTLVPGVTPIRRVHLAELRTALSEAYVAAGRPAPAYSDGALTAGTTVIGAVHMMELRAAVSTLER